MSTSLRRSSAVMAVGTIASRGTGFVRTVMMLAALGSTTRLADVYNVTNVIPNVVYDLLLGGVLTSVVVPVLVQAAREDDDGGEAFAQSLLTIVLVGLGVATVLGVLAAPWIASVYGLDTGRSHDLAVLFLRVFIPQVLCYGLGATAGAILNVRGRFGAPMAAPVLNNVIVIATFAVFMLLPGGTGLRSLTPARQWLLALGTTGGVLAMTVALLPSLRSSGLRLRWRWDTSHPALRSALRLAGWVFGYAAVNQVGYLVVTRLASDARAFTTYSSAYQLFQLPHAIIAVSVITALMPQLSRHAQEERPDLVRGDLSRGLRSSAVLLVPATAALVVIGPAVATAAFAHGETTVAGARSIGAVLAGFAVGLVPFSSYQLLLRAFYARQDSRSPFLVNVVVNVVNVAVDLVAVAVLPDRDVAIGLAAGLTASYVVGAAVAVVLLRRPLGGLDGAAVLRLLVRCVVASGLAAVPAGLLLAMLVHGGRGPLASLVQVVLAGGAFGLAYAWLAGRMRVRELETVLGPLARRLPARLARLVVVPAPPTAAAGAGAEPDARTEPGLDAAAPDEKVPAPAPDSGEGGPFRPGPPLG